MKIGNRRLKRLIKKMLRYDPREFSHHERRYLDYRQHRMTKHEPLFEMAERRLGNYFVGRPARPRALPG